jgi:hypothetical protein
LKKILGYFAALASGAGFLMPRSLRAGKRNWLWIAPCLAIAALIGAPRVARAFRQWEVAMRQAALQEARAAVAAGADGLPDLAALTDPAASSSDPDSRDNAEIRSLVMAAELGPRTPETQQMLLEIAAQERVRWADPFAVPASVSSPGTRTWRSIGPQAARTEFNSTFYKAMDSGRPTAIAIHPTQPNTIFVATSGGGLWSARDFNGNYPTWTPLTETLGSLAVGAFAIDPNAAADGTVTIWLGLGDAFDQQSGVLVKGTWTPSAAGVSPPATATWGAPIVLSTASHPADLKPSAALNVRDIQIDPLNGNHVLVATNEGLYQSTDGATFTVSDLPNSIGLTRESAWQIVYLGSAAGQSSWMVSGVYACPFIAGMTVPPSPPSAGTGSFTCPGDAAAAHYNAGDLWKSTDSGGTWTSARAAGAFPSPITTNVRIDVGRIALGAGPTADPTKTVIYAQSGTAQETSIPAGCFAAPPVPTGGILCTFVAQTAWYLKSIDGGATWATIATGLNTTVTRPAPQPALVLQPTGLVNPTTLVGDPTFDNRNTGCTVMNLGHVQSWYNLSVSVDPANPNRAIFGGDLCSAITKDGGATYSAASHWLPQGGSGFTANGFLPYVHADWHASLAYRDAAANQTVLLAGTDGGLFVTRNIWDVPTPELGQWQQPDVGLTTHLFYGLGTGDPTLGNPNLVFGGLQDNGTRWRLVQDESFIQEFNAGNWDQILGGDGFGAAATSDTIGQNQVYWISVNGSRRFCRPRARDCSQATRIENGVEIPNWTNPGTLGVPDPFLIRYAPLGDDTSGVLSATSNFAVAWFIDQFDRASIRNLGNTNGMNVDGVVASRPIRGMGVRASPYRYTLDGLPNTRLYGGVTVSGATAMASFLIVDHGPVPAPPPATIVGKNSVHFAGVTGVGTGTIWIGNGSDIAMPQNPASLGGTDSKATWLVASNSVLSNAVNCADPKAANCDPAVVIPPAIGHLYKTIDAGTTWTPFHGDGSGFDLPNVPIYVIKYDPADTTDQTIWVGTELGVYRTTDGGTTWGRYGLGLPMVRVTDLQIANNGSVVRVSTYGRGVWEVYPNSEPAVAAGTGDFDRGKVIDFFDLSSLTARMGSDPDATTNLVYDASVDLSTAIPTGKTKTTIDEADLTALLAKFGSNLP